MTDADFDFAAFKRAIENQDVDAWLNFYADEAEWVEYRHNAPPRAPNRMVGKAQIGDFLRRVKGSNVTLAISDEVIGDTRAAFCLTVVMASGKRIIENIIVHFDSGKITRQTDVEAWD
jgi:ketosteroid isomerase-like protein